MTADQVDLKMVSSTVWVGLTVGVFKFNLDFFAVVEMILIKKINYCNAIRSFFYSLVLWPIFGFTA